MHTITVSGSLYTDSNRLRPKEKAKVGKALTCYRSVRRCKRRSLAVTQASFHASEITWRTQSAIELAI